MSATKFLNSVLKSRKKIPIHPQKHAMKKILFTVGFLTLTVCALQATNRVDGRFFTDIRPERLVTPCEPFAADYVRPPKILFLVPGRTGGREVAELKQRFNFTFDAVLYQGPMGVDALGDSSMYVAPIAGALQSEKLEKLNRLLDKEKWDVIVFGHATQFSALSKGPGWCPQAGGFRDRFGPLSTQSQAQRIQVPEGVRGRLSGFGSG
jgi:hypothetical protein